MNLHAQKGFSLVEVLISTIIVGILAVAGWSTASILTETIETARNEENALNLLRQSQEEFRRVAQTNFDQMTSECTFTNAACGFFHDSNTFGQFTRNLRIEDVNPELRRAFMTVSWMERGKPRQISATLSIARPAGALPGNLVGTITPAPNDLEAPWNISLTQGVTTITERVYAVSDSEGRHYNFSDDSTSRPRLEAGNWTLIATRPGYEEYRATIAIASNTTSVHNFTMIPEPKPGSVFGNLINAHNGQKIPAPGGKMKISLYRNGRDPVVRAATGNGPYHFNFEVEFENPPESQRFTLSTSGAYLVGYVGQLPCSPTTTHHADGWSSAIVSESPACGSWIGGPGRDGVVVGPDEHIRIDIPLVPTPQGTITGYVKDISGGPVKDASVYVALHNVSDKGSFTLAGRSDAAGFFSVQAPAEQAFFGNSPSFYPKIFARAVVESLECCNVASTTTADSLIRSVGPLREGDTVGVGDLILSTGPVVRVCGNVAGSVLRATDGSPVANANIRFTDTLRTNAAGDYHFQCPANANAFFKLPAKSHRVVAGDNLSAVYYPFDNQSSTSLRYYTPKTFTVAADQLRRMEAIRLWPKGVNDVTVTVVDKGTKFPIQNVEVQLIHTWYGTRTGRTGPDGASVFENVQETWPPPSAVGNPNMAQTPAKYKARAVDRSGTYEDGEFPGEVEVNAAPAPAVRLTIELNAKGAM